jgi:phospholipid-binding lipoprotein MlaA
MPLRMTLARLFTALAFAAIASGCATTEQRTKKDPWEGMNRATHGFNTALDNVVLKPVSTAYIKVVPDFAREGVNNFFDNLEDLNTGIQNILQGKAKEGFGDLGRLVVNTTLGVFGLWDVATPMGLEKHYEDFGQTLGVWGVGPGPYLVLPLLGPSTIRDAPARVVDPSWWFSEAVNPESLWWGIWGLEKVRTRANLVQSESVLEQAAIDRYSFIRDAWLQRRRSQVYDGSPPRPKDDEDE